MAQNKCEGCIRLEEGVRYSMIFEEDDIVIRKSDGVTGGYLLRNLGTTQTNADGKHLKVLILCSFEEANPE